MHGSKTIAAAALATAAVLGTSVSASARSAAPKVTAHPHQVMVDTATSVAGRGFPADTQIELRECGRTFWMAPADPCLESGVTVTTDAKGRFRTTFRVGLCPEGDATKKPTQRVCWLGAISNGEDTGSLIGAARLIVTYP